MNVEGGPDRVPPPRAICWPPIGPRRASPSPPPLEAPSGRTLVPAATSTRHKPTPATVPHATADRAQGSGTGSLKSVLDLHARCGADVDVLTVGPERRVSDLDRIFSRRELEFRHRR